MELTDQQLLRYSRQIFLPEIDVAGQERLLASHIVVVGAGGLGSMSAPMLAAAGVGKLTLIDFDRIDLSNLARQIPYDEASIDQLKVEKLAERIQQQNRDCELVTIAEKLSQQQMQNVFADVDMVLDGTDNFTTRHTINRACYSVKTPLLSAAAAQFSGQLALFDYVAGSPCYDCLYSNSGDDDNNCANNGVLGPVVAWLASMQALEAIKFLTGMPVASRHHLVTVDTKNVRMHTVALSVDNECSVCSFA
ncbi:MAG: HesA/MoeB/ThiF family protein [Arenicella sp.]